jgi:hypothetical protein
MSRCLLMRRRGRRLAPFAAAGVLPFVLLDGVV